MPNQYIKEGDKKMANADYYAAFFYFNKAYSADSTYTEAVYKMGEASRLFNDYKGAYACYEKVLKTDKYRNFPLAEYYMGNCAKYMDKYALAQDHYKRFNERYAYDDMYKKSMSLELASIAWAIANNRASDSITIIHLDKSINSIYTEFAASELNDSFYQYSALRERASSLTSKETEFLSRIYTLRMENKEWKEYKSLFSWLDKFPNHIANGSFSDDGLRYYFNVCDFVNASDLRCDIYVSEFVNNEWQAPIQLPESINTKNKTNTQPCEANNSRLYFCSDRDGGQGAKDIWYSDRNADGSYGRVINAGSTINTAMNEVTPYFDSKTQRLYFSSDGLLGFGGYDVYYSDYKEGTYSTPQNMMKPINSCANDLYFNVNKNGSGIGYLSSNRSGSLFIKGENCCNDIYKYTTTSKPKTIVPKDSSRIVQQIKKDSTPILTNITNTSKADTPSIIQQLKNVLPVRVYFHNDIPNPRSTADTTVLNYATTYLEYTRMRGMYADSFARSNTEDKNKIDALFTNTIDKGYSDLQQFATLMKKALQSNQKIQITLEGYCSPLAINPYNIHLANRRIASLKNYFWNYENGFFRSYIRSGMLQYVQAPYGEERARPGISDNRLDLQNSVFHPQAALERNVAVIGIEVLK